MIMINPFMCGTSDEGHDPQYNEEALLLPEKDGQLIIPGDRGPVHHENVMSQWTDGTPDGRTTLNKEGVTAPRKGADVTS